MVKKKTQKKLISVFNTIINHGNQKQQMTDVVKDVNYLFISQIKAF